MIDVLHIYATQRMNCAKKKKKRVRISMVVVARQEQ